MNQALADDAHPTAPVAGGSSVSAGGVPDSGASKGGDTRAAGSMTPVVAVVSVLGAALTGLFLLTAERWAPFAAATVCAVVAVVAALLAVIVAVLGQLLTAGSGAARRGVTMVLSAGGLSVLAVLSAGAAALLVPRVGATGAGTEPSVTVLLSGTADARTVLVRMAFPDVAAGSRLDATLVGVENVGDGGPVRTLLARSLIRTGGAGPATAELTATLGADVRNAVATGTVGGRTCTADVSIVDESSPIVRCRG